LAQDFLVQHWLVQRLTSRSPWTIRSMSHQMKLASRPSFLTHTPGRARGCEDRQLFFCRRINNRRRRTRCLTRNWRGNVTMSIAGDMRRGSSRWGLRQLFRTSLAASSFPESRHATLAKPSQAGTQSSVIGARKHISQHRAKGSLLTVGLHGSRPAAPARRVVLPRILCAATG
jgi:hypothetical protein